MFMKAITTMLKVKNMNNEFKLKRKNIRFYIVMNIVFVENYIIFNIIFIYFTFWNCILGYVELACGIVSCEHPLEYFLEKNKKMVRK